MDESAPSAVSGRGAFRVHAPPHRLQAVPPLTTKLSFPAQMRRDQVLNLGSEGEIHMFWQQRVANRHLFLTNTPYGKTQKTEDPEQILYR